MKMWCPRCGEPHLSNNIHRCKRDRSGCRGPSPLTAGTAEAGVTRQDLSGNLVLDTPQAVGAGCDPAAHKQKLEAENDRLRAACERMMVGGNHIATYRTAEWPNYGAEPMAALEKLGAGREYDMWCCWAAIMSARDAAGLR
jgi:hypothetical protein